MTSSIFLSFFFSFFIFTKHRVLLRLIAHDSDPENIIPG